MKKSLATLGSLFPDVINKTLFPMVADLSKEADVEALVGNDTNIAGLGAPCRRGINRVNR
ncbi:MAG: hypothetical protein IPI65_06400 [Bacteroidetes bacterium]|nr:hypothetical protein [Bacteroidota bacterium]